MDAPQDTIAKQLLDAVKDALGNGWSKLAEADRILIAECATDAASLQIEALAASTTAIQDRLKREKAQVAAQLLNIASVEKTAITDAFWKGFGLIADRGMRVLGIVAASAL